MKKFLKGIITIIILPSALTAMGQDAKLSLVNLGNSVNSAYHDSAPVISPDGQRIYFFVNDHHGNSVKGHSQDIWYSDRDSTGTWGEAQHLEKPFNTHRFNQVFTVGPEGNWLLLRGGEGGKNAYKGISVTELDANGEWSSPEELDVEGFPAMAKGSYFGAAMTGEREVLLIYMSEIKGSSYSDLYVAKRTGPLSYTRPEPITMLNTGKDEFGPFLSSDTRTVYFASDRSGGHGNMDVYRSSRLDDTWLNWSIPENLGAPVNTSGFDAYYSEDASGEEMFTTRAYMSADGGSLDIFALVPEPAAQVLAPVHLLVGNVYDAKTQAPIAAELRYYPPDGIEGNVHSQAFDGRYSTELAMDGRYLMSVDAPGYLHLADSLMVALSESGEELRKDFYLEPIEIGSTVRLERIYFDFDSAVLRPESFPELENVANFLTLNPTVKIEVRGHTDDRGADAYNLNLSDGRANAVREYLATKWFSSDRVMARGCGETMPEVPNDCDENRQVNRRVEFVVMDK